MRNKIKEFFLNAENIFISGEELSNQLGISRTAIWKQIKELKKDGYQFEAVRKKGYRLLNLPDDLNLVGVKQNLQTKWLGHELVFYNKLESTQKTAHELARNGASNGTIILADEQTKGKGRLGRQWHSANGKGVWMSIILRPSFTFQQAPLITLLTSVVIAKTLQELYGIPIKIKWPNDIYLQEKKLAGILTEIHGEQDLLQYLIIGIGINTHRTEFPAELDLKAISLEEFLNSPLRRKELVQSLLFNLEKYYERYINEGFSPFYTFYNELLLWKGMQITVNQLNRQLTGINEGINQDGQLLLRQNDGQLIKLFSGDIGV